MEAREKLMNTEIIGFNHTFRNPIIKSEDTIFKKKRIVILKGFVP